MLQTTSTSFLIGSVLLLSQLIGPARGLRANNDAYFARRRQQIPTRRSALDTTKVVASAALNQEDSSNVAGGGDDLFEMEGWRNIADDLDQFPLFAVATAEGSLVSYQVTLNRDQSFNVPCFYCDVAEALIELESAKGNTALEGLKLVPFPLGAAFRMWCKDQAVIVPSRASILQAGAPPGTNPIGQKVPMWACLEISEEQEDGKPPKLPIFMALEDANAAVMEALGADGGKLDDFEVVCLSLSGAIEQLATVPEESPSFHFIPPSTSMQYIEEYHS